MFEEVEKFLKYIVSDHEEMEEIKIISPTMMTFLFHLSEKECHLKFTGKCSLNRFFPHRASDIGEDSDYDHCRKIFKSLVKYGQKYRVDIIKYRCGHYDFNDGQHRVCIAKRKGLKLKALITTLNDEDCDFCGGVKRKNQDLR